MTIGEIRLERKSGGRSGTWERAEAESDRSSDPGPESAALPPPRANL